MLLFILRKHCARYNVTELPEFVPEPNVNHRGGRSENRHISYVYSHTNCFCNGHLFLYQISVVDVGGAGKEYHPTDSFIITNMGQSMIKMCDISI